MKVLILGVNGFIGNALVKRILDKTDWEVAGMDLSSHKLGCICDNERFNFIAGDITEDREWVDEYIDWADAVLPLVAIATPATYVKEPLKVFVLDFEENLRIVRKCVELRKRLVFPSTSEVYGMSSDSEFDEDITPLVLGPICKSRWIYSCAKQMLDRVIHAYGEKEGFNYTLFRPFNWIGPLLDGIETAKIGSSRVITQFIINLLEGKPIKLVDGGNQKRCFTYITDGIDALIKILKDEGKTTNREIINIGNPEGECSIKELADKTAELYRELCPDLAREHPPQIISVSSMEYYGAGFQDIAFRKPKIEKAKKLLNWSPKVSLDRALRLTFEHALAADQIIY